MSTKPPDDDEGDFLVAAPEAFFGLSTSMVVALKGSPSLV
jgi:hypothetical protein